MIGCETLSEFIVRCMRESNCPVHSVGFILRKMRRYGDSQDRMYRPVLKAMHKLEDDKILDSVMGTMNERSWWLTERLS